VLNNYQRRADLIPNLVATVQGAADFREIHADRDRQGARLGGLHQRDAGAGQRSGSLREIPGGAGADDQRAVAAARRGGNYPQLTATKEFGELRVELAGAENRISVARGRYIKAVQEYNILARQFPTNLTAMLFGYKPKANFTVDNEKAIAAPPKVDFSKPAAK
jgi:LemA protein